MPADDQVMLPFLKRYGRWDPEEGDLLLRLARPGITFVDVGASFGYFSRLLALKVHSVTVHAFEPIPSMVKLLGLNTWEFADRVTVWPTALGAERGSIGLISSPENIGDTRSSSDQDKYNIVAALSRLDDCIDGPVDLVKMDTQGYETEVILGMTRICQQNPRIQIVAEFWPAAIIDRHLKPADVLSRYRSLGFETCLLDGVHALPANDDEIILFASGAGRNGQATLLLRRPL